MLGLTKQARSFGVHACELRSPKTSRFGVTVSGVRSSDSPHVCNILERHTGTCTICESMIVILRYYYDDPSSVFIYSFPHQLRADQYIHSS
jgi:hypothetical protein